MALVSEVFEQHLGGHILQVRSRPSPLLRARCHLVVAYGNITHFPVPVPCGALGRRSLVPAPSLGSWKSLISRRRPRSQKQGALPTPAPFLSILVPGWLRVRLEPGRKIPLHLRDSVHLPGSLPGKNPHTGPPYLPPGLCMPLLSAGIANPNMKKRQPSLKPHKAPDTCWRNSGRTTSSKPARSTW